MVVIDTLARALTSVRTSAEYSDRNYWCTILYYYTCQTKDEIIMILDVQDLSFRYSKNTKPIFHNVNLQMEKWRNSHNSWRQWCRKINAFKLSGQIFWNLIPERFW